MSSRALQAGTSTEATEIRKPGDEPLKPKFKPKKVTIATKIKPAIIKTTKIIKNRDGSLETVNAKTKVSGGIKKRKAKGKKITKTKQVPRNELALTTYCIRVLAFQRLVREIMQDYRDDTRFQRSAMDALQTGAEYYLSNLFKEADTVRWYESKNRVTLMPKDIKAVLELRDPPAISKEMAVYLGKVPKKKVIKRGSKNAKAAEKTATGPEKMIVEEPEKAN